MRVDLRPHGTRTSCPYCRGTIDRGESSWRCPRCATLHHSECAGQNGRCTVLACDAAYRSTLGRPSFTALLSVGAAAAFFLFVSLPGRTVAAPRTSPAAAPVRAPDPIVAAPEPIVMALEPIVAPAPVSVDPLAPSRRLGATTTWRDADPAIWYLIEETVSTGARSLQARRYLGGREKAVLAVSLSRSIEVPMEEDQLEGWTVVSPEADEVYTTKTDVIPCRRFVGLKRCPDGEVAAVEVWLNRHYPVPVKSIGTVRGVTTMRTLSKTMLR